MFDLCILHDLAEEQIGEKLHDACPRNSKLETQYIFLLVCFTKKVMCQNRFGKFIGHRLSPNLETERTLVARSLKLNLEFVISVKTADT